MTRTVLRVEALATSEGPLVFAELIMVPSRLVLHHGPGAGGRHGPR